MNVYMAVMHAQIEKLTTIMQKGDEFDKALDLIVELRDFVPPLRHQTSAPNSE